MVLFIFIQILIEHFVAPTHLDIHFKSKRNFIFFSFYFLNAANNLTQKYTRGKNVLGPWVAHLRMHIYKVREKALSHQTTLVRHYTLAPEQRTGFINLMYRLQKMAESCFVESVSANSIINLHKMLRFSIMPYSYGHRRL